MLLIKETVFSMSEDFQKHIMEDGFLRTSWQPAHLTWIGGEKIKKPLLHGSSFICFFTAPVETWPHELLLKPGLLN